MSMPGEVRALVVGAGAVGQVYGRALERGGAHVTFLVKPKHAEAARAGFTLYALNDRRRRTDPEHWTRYGVTTSADEVGREHWDQVYLTVSSPALRGPWLPELCERIGDATLVMLQPGLDDRELVLGFFPADRLVQGLIGLISYVAPLPGETRFPEPGVAYWFPPLGASPFSGPAERVQAVIAALRRGRFPARRHPDVARFAGLPSAVMMPYLSALEVSGWTFRGLRTGGRLGEAGRAAKEALATLAVRDDVRPGMLALAARPTVMRAGLWLGRHVLPLDLESYLRVHFTKTGEQTRMMMARFVELARAQGREVPALAGLSAALPALSGKTEAGLASG